MELTIEQLETAGKVIPSRQYSLIQELLKGEEKNYFAESLAKIAEAVAKAPAFYATDGQEKHTLVLHYFFGQTDIYICEIDLKSDEYFGYTIINGDRQSAEWGYGSFSDLRKSDLLEIEFISEEKKDIEDFIKKEVA